MNALHARRNFAAATLLMLAASASAHAARPAPVYADVLITFAGQSFGFAGQLRDFVVSDAGGRVTLDLAMLETPGYTPLPDIDVAELRAPGNGWQVVTYVNRSAVTFTGTCAVESFRTFEAGVTMQHVYLNCVDLET